MCQKNVLMVSREPTLVDRIRKDLKSRGPLRLHAVASTDEVCFQSRGEDPSLIVVHLDGLINLAQVATLIDLRSTEGRRVPVLALVDDYRVEQASALFRLGVADYLSLADHREQLAAVIGALTVPDRASRTAVPARRSKAQRWKLSPQTP